MERLAKRIGSTIGDGLESKDTRRISAREFEQAKDSGNCVEVRTTVHALKVGEQ